MALALDEPEPVGPSIGRAESSAKAPRFLGDYELLEEIGRGGMGVVFRARQMSLDRVVAVKMVLAGQFAGDAFVRRFRTEAQAAANLRHPNIVPVHEVSEHEGQPFFSMEWVEGQSLADLVRDQPLPPRQAATYLATIARAIHYAHEQGIIHRDLKPSNILIDRLDAPRITDFGLAKRLQPESKLDLTLTGQTLGTPNYMPPEQVSAQPAEASPRSDIYSLGAIFYHLLTGRPLFLAATVESALDQLLHTEPVAPRLLNPGVPRDLETICLKCLNKDPERRYPSARALAEDLGRWLNGESILARPTLAPEKLWRWCRRKPALAALWGALLIAVVGGVSGVLWQWRQAREELWRAQLAQARAERRSGEAGQRFRSLDALARAAAIRPSPELRNEAIAALALIDVRFVPVWTNPNPNPNPSWHPRFSPGLERFAVSSSGGRVKVLRTVDGREEMALPAVGGTAERMTFSLDSQFLAAQYSSGTNVVWDLSTQKQVLGWGPGKVPGAFTHTKNRVLCADSSGTVRCVTLEHGQELWRCTIGPGLWSVVVQPQEKYFAAQFGRSPEAQVRDLNTGELVRTLTHPSPLGALEWRPDGKTLLVSGETGWLYAWDLDLKAGPTSWKAHDDAIVGLSFELSSRYLASVSWDGSLRLWNLPDYRPAVIARGNQATFDAQFSSDGRRVAAAFRGQTLGLFDIASSTVVRRLHVPPSDERGAWNIDVSPDGKLVAAGYTDGLRVLDFATGAEVELRSFLGCRSVMFTPNGEALLTCGDSGLTRWPIERVNATGQVRLGLRESISDAPRLYASLTADGRWAAAADQPNNQVRVYEVNNPTNRFSLANHGAIQHVAFSPDGRWVATGTWVGRGVRIWDVASRRLVKELPLGRAAVAFSPDARLLVTGSQHSQVWETGTWRELYRTPDTGTTAGPSAFSPDGRILAVVKDQRIVLLLVAETGRVLAELEAPGSTSISGMRFSPDGTALLALEWTRDIQVWDLRRLRIELAALKLDWAD
jgi:serine/threonine protein kinase/WD40 repeat protein